MRRREPRAWAILRVAVGVVLLASAAHAQSLPLRTYPPGTHRFGPVPIPDVARGVAVTVDVREHTHPEAFWRACVDLSLDGGLTWVAGWHCVGRTGGTLLDNQTGVALTTAGFRKRLPPGLARLARGWLHTTRALRTEVAVEWLTKP